MAADSACKGRNFGPAGAGKLVRGRREDVARGSGGGPDFGKVEQAWIEPGGQGGQMAQGGDAADGKAGDGAHGLAIGAAKGFGSKAGGKVEVDAVSARSEEKVKAAACALKEDGFDDLVQRAADGRGGFFGGAGFARHFDGNAGQPCCLQGGGHAG